VVRHRLILSTRRLIALCALGLLLITGVLVGRGTLPSLDNRSTSAAFIETATTRLGKAITPLVEAHPGTSGIYPLLDSRDAFAARVLLARAADRSLDVQYYIWHEDMSGTLLFEALHEAAERGVRVRLLLDDNNTSGLDPTLGALDSHRNIEVRLFNPFVIRAPRAIGYLTDFFRLNRRMHNKSFTADNQATIIGGRNVGDEYFDATDGTVFVDLDLIAVGPVVTDVSENFDRYWASDSSYPVDRLLPPADTARIKRLAAAASHVGRDPVAAAYMKALRDSPFMRDLLERRLALEWAPTRMVSDDPAKGLGLASSESLVPQKLKAIIGQPADVVELVSAYFVPGSEGVESFVSMAERGVKIRVLTNSLDATDVAAVHAGYAKRRKPLLEAGIKLYELRRSWRAAVVDRGEPSFGSSGSSLHAKTFAVDGSHAFIGSFNFDPRSAKLNTEMGFVIDSPALAQGIQSAFDVRIPVRSYEVRLSNNGELYWIERQEGNEIRHDTEPGTSTWQRTGVWLLSLLPIEWLL
jgi:cardiolipin synthase C